MRIAHTKLRSIHSAVFAMLLLCATACSLSGTTDSPVDDPLTAHERAWLSDHDGRIRYAPNPSSPPIESIDQDGAVVGITTEYLAEIPTPGCVWLSTQPDWPPVTYEIQTCNDGTVLLTNESSDGTSIERYNFSTGNWSSVSFLDGACSYLR